MPAPPAAEAWRFSLPPHPDIRGIEAVWLDADARDWQALWHPGIAAHAAAGPPPSGSLLPLIREPRLDQGQEGSCVPFSTSGKCQMTRSVISASWPDYAGHQLYAEAGGSGNSGVDARTTLNIVIAKGTPLVSGGRDMVIKSYLFVDRDPGLFRTQIKASIAAGEPVLVASLLPIPFGWNTGMVLSSGYHQYLGVDYHTDNQSKEWLVVMNSWGDGWPGDAPAGTPRGVGRISFDALLQNNLQNGYTYAIIPTALTITPPPPPPATLSISAYVPNPSGSGGTVLIQGSGFAPGATAIYQGGNLPLTYLDPTRINAQAPVLSQGGTGPVRLSSGGQSVTGPDLTVLPPAPPPPVTTRTLSGLASGSGLQTLATGQKLTLAGPNFSGELQITQIDDNQIPIPPPPPPGALKVNVVAGPHHIVACTVQDSDGVYLEANCTATAGGRDMGLRQTHPLGATALPAVWLATGLAAGTIVVVTAQAAGKTAQGSVTL